jgi:hypothetical protein
MAMPSVASASAASVLATTEVGGRSASGGRGHNGLRGRVTQ